jgi:hypothetical protein
MRKFLYVIILSTFGVACIYLGWWIFRGRLSDSRALIRSIEESKAAQNRAVAAAYGEGRLTILQFYASPAIIRKGKAAQLCYGVSHSKSVRIEPPLGETWPSLARCIDITPQQDTTYSLIAEDESGNTKTASLTIKVK